MIFYYDKNNHLNLFDSSCFDGEENYDPLIEIAIDIAVNGYRGIVVHHQKLKNGKYFFGINFREDTIEGKLFSQIHRNFNHGRKIPTSQRVLDKLKRAYAKRQRS